ncbi:MAG: hypothetical protein GC189_13645 [Alphaproteobacteria bacterium]|nr:hypothetical protein [Alphaproteobacteria bacterium]
MGAAYAQDAISPNESDDWRRAMLRDDAATYETYLRAHPDGDNALEARRRVQAERDADRFAWDRARALDTPQSYLSYRAAHPDGAWRAEAGARADGFLQALPPSSVPTPAPLTLPGHTPTPPTYFPPPPPPR